MNTITRQMIIQKLLEWKEGKISEEELEKFSDDWMASDDMELEDWETEDKSVSREILGAISMMDLDLLTKDDVGACIKFLKTPLGEYDKGYKEFDGYRKTVDYPKRSKELSSNPFYFNKEK